MAVNNNTHMAHRNRFTLAVSMGDCNGIGLEVFAKALEILQSDKNLIPGPVSYRLAAHPQVVEQYYRQLGVQAVVNDGSIAINGVECELISCSSSAEVLPGTVDLAAGALAWESLEKAVADVQHGISDALLTLPVSKSTLKMAGYPFPGQTEFLAARCGGSQPLMILCTSDVRVGLVTIHIPLAAVPAALTQQAITRSVVAFHSSIQGDFGCDNPRIAVLGVNPHAGEHGEIGQEELQVVIPALAECTAAGIRAEGPFPADGFFAHGAYKEYDGILAMYHDQGLIPLKMLARGGGVNVTAGLPIVRSSPDHGTAYAIAGKGIADAASTVEAICMAWHIADVRRSSALQHSGAGYVL